MDWGAGRVLEFLLQTRPSPLARDIHYPADPSPTTDDGTRSDKRPRAHQASINHPAKEPPETRAPQKQGPSKGTPDPLDHRTCTELRTRRAALLPSHPSHPRPRTPTFSIFTSRLYLYVVSDRHGRQVVTAVKELTISPHQNNIAPAC
ncbi:hypothetical protein K456DRAFT_29817 [Colletotrichum gloeosporioides 23]|nr:hypothetical protein K456DRAFT_29817 [Colletotrichum gloeosporioides 23]